MKQYHSTELQNAETYKKRYIKGQQLLLLYCYDSYYYYSLSKTTLIDKQKLKNGNYETPRRTVIIIQTLIRT